MSDLNESAVLAHFRQPGETYQTTADAFATSRGSIYKIVMANGARKNEHRIRERAAERKARQQDALKAIIDSTATADVLDFLDSLPDDCAQLVVTSIPYNLGKRYGGSAGADSMAHVYYMGWMAMIISEISRVLKPGGVVVLQAGSTRDETDTIVPLDILLYETLKKTGMQFQNRIAWLIPHGLTPKRRLAERHETALVFSKGDPAVFNPTPVRTPQKQPGKRAFKGPNKGQISSHPQGAFPSNVWEIGNVGANHPEKTGHPAQFPVEFARRAIHLYTMPGDLVIDPFSGSGTTHEAARRTGRAFTGADLFYEDMRQKRLAAVEPDTVSLLPGVTDESVAVWQAEARRVSSQPDFNDAQTQLFAA